MGQSTPAVSPGMSWAVCHLVVVWKQSRGKRICEEKVVLQELRKLGKKSGKAGHFPHQFALSFYTNSVLHQGIAPLHCTTDLCLQVNFEDFISDPTSGNGNIQGGKSPFLLLDGCTGWCRHPWAHPKQEHGVVALQRSHSSLGDARAEVGREGGRFGELQPQKYQQKMLEINWGDQGNVQTDTENEPFPWNSDYCSELMVYLLPILYSQSSAALLGLILFIPTEEIFLGGRRLAWERLFSGVQAQLL